MAERILVVDDARENVVLLEGLLNDDGFAVDSAYDGKDCLERVSVSGRGLPDLILLDIQMPTIDGIETLKELKARKRSADIPVIMVSANDSDKNIVEALDLGASDFVGKPIVYPVLRARIQSALRVARANAELLKMNKDLYRLATRDSLTRCFNRRHFQELSTRELARAARTGSSSVMMMIDIDHFKTINDKYGHELGDSSLHHLVCCCQQNIRNCDILGRLGGEEFAVFCPGTDLSAGIQLAERLRAACERMTISAAGRRCSITVSIGVVEVMHNEHLRSVFKRSDELLYEAKARGRNQVIADIGGSVHCHLA